MHWNCVMSQECIPVGCVPPAAVGILGGSPHPPRADPPGSRQPPQGAGYPPGEQAPPQSRHPPGSRHPPIWSRHPPSRHHPPRAGTTSQSRHPLERASPRADTPPGADTHTPRDQNHRRLWKYNLAPTSLRAVKMADIYYMGWLHETEICSRTDNDNHHLSAFIWLRKHWSISLLSWVW